MNDLEMESLRLICMPMGSWRLGLFKRPVVDSRHVYTEERRIEMGGFIVCYLRWMLGRDKVTDFRWYQKICHSSTMIY